MKQCIIVLCGIVGSGKSTLAKALLEIMPELEYISSDIVRKGVFGIKPEERSNSKGDGIDIYTKEASAITFAQVRENARAAMDKGKSVIIDATNITKWQRAPYKVIADEYDAKCYVVACVQPDWPILRQRLEKREQEGTDPSEAGYEIAQRMSKTWENPDTSECDAVMYTEVREPISAFAQAVSIMIMGAPDES